MRFQVKGPEPGNRWVTRSLNFPHTQGNHVGEQETIGGTIGDVHVHCGGWESLQGATSGCFGLRMNAQDRMTMKRLADLPQKLQVACYGSDGERLAVAGGLVFDSEIGRFVYQDGVIVLEGVNSTWRRAEAKLSGLKVRQAGVLLGDYLLCLGGREDEVGKGGVYPARFAVSGVDFLEWVEVQARACYSTFSGDPKQVLAGW